MCKSFERSERDWDKLLGAKSYGGGVERKGESIGREQKRGREPKSSTKQCMGCRKGEGYGLRTEES